MRTLDCFIPVIDNFGDIWFAMQVVRGFLARHADWNVRVFTTDTKKTAFLLQGTPLERCEIFDASVRHEQEFRISETVFCFFGFRLESEVLLTRTEEKRVVQFDYLLLQGPNESHNGIASLHGSTWTDTETNTTVTHYVPSLLVVWGGVPLPFVTFSQMSRSPGTSCVTPKTVSVFCYGPSEAAIASGLVKAQSELGYPSSVSWFSLSSNVPAGWQKDFLPLDEYSAFLATCEANIVRGENSVVASLLSGKPTLWDPYREKAGQEKAKLEDYLTFLSETFGEWDWTEYQSISRNFIHADPCVWSDAVFRFLSNQEKLKENFASIPDWIEKNADLQKKLEQTIWFFS